MLGNPDSISLLQSIIISLCGMCIVFLCLSCLILAIKLLGGIFQGLTGTGVRSVSPVKTTQEMDEDAFAVLICAVSEASGLPLGSFRIKSIMSVNK